MPKARPVPRVSPGGAPPAPEWAPAISFHLGNLAAKIMPAGDWLLGTDARLLHSLVPFPRQDTELHKCAYRGEKGGVLAALVDNDNVFLTN